VKIFRFARVSFLSTGFLLLAAIPGLTQQELFKLTAANPDEDDYFGISVCICGDRGVVGQANFGSYGYGLGRAHVFDLKTGQLLHELSSSDNKVIDDFGESVALNGDRVVVGAPRTDDAGHDSGSVYFFDLATGQELMEVNASDGSSGTHFGGSVAISGSLLVVGARNASGAATNSGAAYVLDVSTGQELRKLVATDGKDGDQLGSDVAIHGDRALIGSVGNNGYVGAAYLFDVTTGQELWKFRLVGGQPLDYFGRSVAISADHAVVGASPYAITPPPGTAYVYDLVTRQLLFELTPADGHPHQDFADALSLSSDHLLVGAYGDDDLGSSAGAAYLYDVNTGQELAKLHASDGWSGDFFGSCVSISGDRALVGSPWSDHSGEGEAGAAYVFAVPNEPGVGFCFGDPGSGTPCPCDNDNDGSVPGSGCDNGVFASGAKLTGSGYAGVSGDSLVLTTTGLEPNNSGLYFQADNAIAGGDGVWFGDGLRCAGGNLKRIQVRFADAAGTSSTTISIAQKCAVSPGDTLRYQCWYRNQSTPACGLGVNEFNLSNGYEICWAP